MGIPRGLAAWAKYERDQRDMRLKREAEEAQQAPPDLRNGPAPGPSIYEQAQANLAKLNQRLSKEPSQ